MKNLTFVHYQFVFLNVKINNILFLLIEFIEMSFNLFNRNHSKKNQSHIKNLIEVALSDGNIDEDEMMLLLNLATRLGITKEEIYQIKMNPGSVKFNPPVGAKERFNQIYDLVCMMMINGQVNKNELKLCKELALKLGYLPLIVDDFILMITKNISEGVSSRDTFNKAMELYK